MSYRLAPGVQHPEQVRDVARESLSLRAWAGLRFLEIPSTDVFGCQSVDASDPIRHSLGILAR